MESRDQVNAKQVLFSSHEVGNLLRDLQSYASLYGDWIEQIIIMRTSDGYVACVWERLDEAGG